MASRYGRVSPGEGVVVNPSTVIAETIIDEAIRCGVSEFVVAPGSRNAPLTIAVARAVNAGRARMHTRIDERSAGFLALGLAKASGRASAVITTSGTATANLHPAVLEASHSDIPLVVITADRPLELRATGANQTMDQHGLYGRSVRHFAEIGDVVDGAFLRSATARAVQATASGPVHINVPLREPLIGEGEPLPGRSADLPWTTVMEPFPHSFDISLDLPERGVVVVAHDHGISSEEIESFASAVSWPIISEDPLSMSTAIGHAALFLTSEKIRTALKAEMAIVIGRPVLSRSVATYLRECDRVVVVDPSFEWSDPQRLAELVLSTLPVAEGESNPQWLSSWKEEERRAAKEIASLPSWSEQKLLAAFCASLPAEAALFVGASRPIRDIEGFASPRTGISSFANRGLAGIDGSVSTAIGLALGGDLPTYAVMGDLTFLHDINGLLIAPEDELPDLTILVVNNNGGGIFSTLPQSGVDSFDRIFGTPHERSIADIARAYGAEVIEIDSVDQMQAITLVPKGLKVVVANMPSRDKNASSLKGLNF